MSEIYANTLIANTSAATEVIKPDGNPFTWLFYLLTFIVLCWLLKKILWKPVTDFLDKRSESITSSIDNATSLKKEAEGMKAEYERLLEEAKVEAGKIIEDARYRGQKEYNAIIDAAYRDAEAFKSKTRKDLAREREEMFHKLKSEISGIAIAAATKVVEANMDTERNKELVDKFLSEEGVA